MSNVINLAAERAARKYDRDTLLCLAEPLQEIASLLDIPRDGFVKEDKVVLGELLALCAEGMRDIIAVRF